jgi:hypothetical protein
MAALATASAQGLFISSCTYSSRTSPPTSPPRHQQATSGGPRWPLDLPQTAVCRLIALLTLLLHCCWMGWSQLQACTPSRGCLLSSSAALLTQNWPTWAWLLMLLHLPAARAAPCSSPGCPCCQLCWELRLRASWCHLAAWLDP